MEPIISPWIIYLISVLNAIYIASLVAIMIDMLVMMALGMALLGIMTDEERIAIKSYGKTGFKVLGVLVVLALIIPSKETLYTMLITSYVTPDNIQIAQSSIVDFVKQISLAISQASK